MRENRSDGSEGGEDGVLSYPYTRFIYDCEGLFNSMFQGQILQRRLARRERSALLAKKA
jgi:hypothetical protein